MNIIENKSLVKISERSIFYKIKVFLKNIFNKKEIEITINRGKSCNNGKNDFIKSVKNIENADTELLKLQKRYEANEINEEELSDEQINDLIKLYQVQIEALEKSNFLRKQKLLKYRKNMIESDVT